MDEQKHTAFSLKYEGKSYGEIAADPKVKLAKATLETYLAPDGLWGAEYRLFCKERNKLIEESVVSIFKGVAEVAASGMMEALKDAKEEVLGVQSAISKAKEDYAVIPDNELEKKRIYLDKIVELRDLLFKAHHRVMDYSERVLDRAGMPIIKRLEVEDDRNELTREELAAILRDAGLDPEQISYKSKAPARQEGAM